jgi:hypothetical protein
MKWTGEKVLARLTEAERSLRAMTRRDRALVASSGAYWPDIAGDKKTDYAPDQTRVKGQKLYASMTLEQITEVWPRWLMPLSVKDRAMVTWRVHERPKSFKNLGKLFGYSRQTAAKRYYRILDLIARDLNKNEHLKK